MAEKRSPEGKAAKIRYNTRFNKAAYDRICVYVPKGMRDVWKKKAEARGQSVSQMCVEAVEGLEEQK